MTRTEEHVKRDAPLKPGQAGKLEDPRESRKNWVNLSQLPATEKRQVWNHIQTEEPATAELLQDPLVKEMQNLFNADVFIETDKTKGR